MSSAPTGLLDSILKPVRDTVGVVLLKSMGWRQGQGIGPRQTANEKQQRRKLVKVGNSETNSWCIFLLVLFSSLKEFTVVLWAPLSKRMKNRRMMKNQKTETYCLRLTTCPLSQWLPRPTALEWATQALIKILSYSQVPAIFLYSRLQTRS
jgi:G-patch domain